MDLAPICLFVFNRIDETTKTVEALKKNNLAVLSDLIIFSDGPRNLKDLDKIKHVREYIHKVDGFKSISIIENNKNKGLAKSIIDGVTEIINKYGKIIVLEDDLITSKNFLDFCNQSLEYYKDNKKIFSISGYTMELKSLNNIDVDFYYGLRASSWGWGTWLDRWNIIDWEIKDYSKFKYNIYKNIRFMQGGSDMPYMLWKQMNNRLDSWAIRWCYNQFKFEMYTVFPSKSKVYSIGFGDNATNTKKDSRFITFLDNNNNILFYFDNRITLDMNIINDFRSKFSIINRIKNKYL